MNDILGRLEKKRTQRGQAAGNNASRLNTAAAR